MNTTCAIALLAVSLVLAPTPAAAAGALPLLGLAALARRRGVRPV